MDNFGDYLGVRQTKPYIAHKFPYITHDIPYIAHDKPYIAHRARWQHTESESEFGLFPL